MDRENNEIHSRNQGKNPNGETLPSAIPLLRGVSVPQDPSTGELPVFICHSHIGTAFHSEKESIFDLVKVYVTAGSESTKKAKNVFTGIFEGAKKMVLRGIAK